MAATVNNPWITLQEKRNGVDVQRKYAGHMNRINHADNSVQFCIVEYWERELYPNGLPIKTELKTYRLENLSYTEVEENGQLYYMEALPVLDGFIAQLGQPFIVDAARETLMNHITLPLNAEPNYPLRRDTREKILKE